MGDMEHDALSKLFFALPWVQADLLRILAPDWAHLLDLQSLERVSAEHPAPDLTRRAGDLAWRVRFREGAAAAGTAPWLLVPVEFQSTVDPGMGARMREYVERHLGALRREGAWSREGGEPPVLPLVVYDGLQRWRRGAGPLAGLPEPVARGLAALQPGDYRLLDAGAGALEDWPVGNRVSAWVRLLRAGTAAALRAALRGGLSEFPGPGDAEFRRALRLWALALLKAGAWSSDDLAAFEDDQGDSKMTTLIEANGEKIRAGLIEEGRAEGIEQGIQRGIERGMQQGIQRGIERGMQQGIQRGIEQGLQRGMQQGLQRGMQQGLQRGRSEERERLRRELSRALDPETAARVSQLLERVG